MRPLTSEDRAAILLDVLGKDVAADVLAQLEPANAVRIRSRLGEFADDRPAHHQIDLVLDEVEHLMRFAGEPQGATPDSDSETESADEGEDDQQAHVRLYDADAGEDAAPDGPLEALAAMDSARLAAALTGELPRTIAVLLSQLPDERTGEVLKLLPDETRGDVFLQLKDDLDARPTLVDRIASITLERAARIDPSTVSSQKPAPDKRMATLLRSLEKADRTRFLEELEQQDEDLANLVRDQLYVIADLVGVHDRSLQKLLADIDTPTLARCLKDVDAALVEKVKRNMSQRARDSLAEEMDLAQMATPDDVEMAQKKLLEAMAKLDQAGELLME